MGGFLTWCVWPSNHARVCLIPYFSMYWQPQWSIVERHTTIRSFYATMLLTTETLGPSLWLLKIEKMLKTARLKCPQHCVGPSVTLVLWWWGWRGWFVCCVVFFFEFGMFFVLDSWRWRGRQKNSGAVGRNSMLWSRVRGRLLHLVWTAQTWMQQSMVPVVALALCLLFLLVLLFW